VHAATEAEVLVVATSRVGVVGVVEPLRVAAAGGERLDERRAFGNGDASDLDIGQRGALCQHLNRWFVAQQFLHRPGASTPTRGAAVPVSRVAQQGEHTVSDQVDGGLMSGDEQQDRGCGELPLRVLFGRRARSPLTAAYPR
jgi:hypothetical protein